MCEWLVLLIFLFAWLSSLSATTETKFILKLFFPGRKHSVDDIIATVLAVNPMKFVYRGRIAIFSIKVLKDQRICVIAEQRPDCTEEESL